MDYFTKQSVNPSNAPKTGAEEKQKKIEDKSFLQRSAHLRKQQNDLEFVKKCTHKPMVSEEKVVNQNGNGKRRAPHINTEAGTGV